MRENHPASQTDKFQMENVLENLYSAWIWQQIDKRYIMEHLHPHWPYRY